jgi:hypothetical protein
MWYVDMEAAREWGIPPWIVTGDNNRVLWSYRFEVVYGIKAELSRKNNGG